jgi:hypothetical protein
MHYIGTGAPARFGSFRERAIILLEFDPVTLTRRAGEIFPKVSYGEAGTVWSRAAAFFRFASESHEMRRVRSTNALFHLLLSACGVNFYTFMAQEKNTHSY